MKIKKSHLQVIIRRILAESAFLIGEGPHDPGRFKAIFMAGCPGSGKGTVLKGIFGTDSGTTYQGLKIVNPDSLYEFLLSNAGLPLKQPDLSADDPELKAYQSSAGKLQYKSGMKMTGGSKGISPESVGLDPHTHGYKPAKKKRAHSRLEMYIQNNLGLVIDGTASNFEKISREKKILEDLGYSTMMVAVNVPVDVALERNKQRGTAGKRSIDDRAVISTCNKLIPNLEKYSALFGSHCIEIDNTQQLDQTLTQELLKKINTFISTPPKQIDTGIRDPDSDADDAAELRDIANDMESLAEVWQVFLNEGAFDVQNFSSFPQAVRSTILGHSDRLIVVVDIPNEGPTAFYQSTGTGTPELGTENMWLPMGGASIMSNGDPWIVKYKDGKVPPESHVYYKVGVRLAKAYGTQTFSETELWKWSIAQGYPHPHDIHNVTGKNHPKGMAFNDYGPMILNLWLNRLGALKPSWSSQPLSGAKNDTHWGSFKDVTADLRQRIAKVKGDPDSDADDAAELRDMAADLKAQKNNT